MPVVTFDTSKLPAALWAALKWLLSRLASLVLPPGVAVVVALAMHQSGCVPPHRPPQPEPPPYDPTPGPKPPPPVVKGAWLVGVVDNNARTQDLAAILMDHQLAVWLDAAGVKWRVYDVQQAEYLARHYDTTLRDAGVTPPAMILLDAGGKALKVGAAPKDSDAVKAFVGGGVKAAEEESAAESIDDGTGHRRFLGLLPRSKAKFAAPKGGEWADANPVIPRDKWREVNRRDAFPADQWVYDQDGLGACVGNGSTNALRKCRVLAGMKDQRLAPGCTYAQINGGHDGGAVISDSLTALQQTGTITSATLGSDEKPCFLNKLPSGWKEEAKRFRIEEAYHCNGFDEMGSAIQLGYVLVYGMQVGNNFNQFTPEGVAGVSRGTGNHCMHADGMHKLNNGQWSFDNVNSWGAGWGPWKNGRCYLIEAHFQNGDQPDAYAVKAATEDPQEPNRPPKLGAADPFSPANAAKGLCPCDDGSPCCCDPGKCGCAGGCSCKEGRSRCKPLVVAQSDAMRRNLCACTGDADCTCSGECRCAACGAKPGNPWREGANGWWRYAQPQIRSLGERPNFAPPLLPATTFGGACRGGS